MQELLAQRPRLAGTTVVVVGAGASGEAAARLIRREGGAVRLLERNPDVVGSAMLALAEEVGIEVVTGPHTPAHFADAALVVTSPGVPFKVLRPLLAAAGSPPLVAELELAWRFVTEPVLAITGTGGKTTTASVAAAMLAEAGKRVFLGGNIGTPLSDYVTGNETADVLVLEVSSFQLLGCDTFRPNVGVLLNISPNHLDQHESMDEYVAAKFSLFARQGRDDLAIFGRELEGEVRARAIAARKEFFTVTDRFSETRLIGRHNLANLEAAYLAVRAFGVSEEAAHRAAASFAPIPDRLEFVGEWNGVTYINDSKCTTVSALGMALESMTRPVILLAGGVFKGGDVAALTPLLRQKVKAVALFGGSREIFAGAWEGAVPLTWSATLEDAMHGARALAGAGDAILLAPATSSYDQYPNYVARGADFRRIAAMLR